MYQKINSQWEIKRKDKIFTEFIDNARNMTLKEFDFTCVSSIQFSLVTEDGRQMITEEGIPICTEENIYFKDKLDKTIHQLIQDAIDWWDNYLNEIDAIIATK